MNLGAAEIASYKHLSTNFNHRVGVRNRGLPTNSEEVHSSFQAGVNFCTIGFGIFFVVLAIGFLSWNEGYVMGLVESYESAVSKGNPVQDISQIDPNLEGKLIFVSGPISSDKILHDPLTNISLQAVKLHRKVEMYQWIETQREREIKVDGRITSKVSSSYEKAWQEALVDSGNFKESLIHRNPKKFRLHNLKQEANYVNIGAYRLSNYLIGHMTEFKSVPINPYKINSHFKIWYSSLYTGLDPFHPNIGDYKLTYTYAGLSGDSPDQVSVLGEQRTTKEGITEIVPHNTADGIVMVVVMEAKQYLDLFEKKLQPTPVTWFIRIICLILMYLGLISLSGVFSIIVNFLKGDQRIIFFPSVGKLTAAAFICCLLISVQWFHFKPLYGTVVLILGPIPCLLIVVCCRKCQEWMDEDEDDDDNDDDEEE